AASVLTACAAMSAATDRAGPAPMSLGERWRDPARIRDLATVVLAARPGAPNAPGGVRMLDSPLMDISSRQLRPRAARGRSLRYLVPEAVLRYIEEHRLYR